MQFTAKQKTVITQAMAARAARVFTQNAKTLTLSNAICALTEQCLSCERQLGDIDEATEDRSNISVRSAVHLAQHFKNPAELVERLAFLFALTGCLKETALLMARVDGADGILYMKRSQHVMDGRVWTSYDRFDITAEDMMNACADHVEREGCASAVVATLLLAAGEESIKDCH